MNHASRLAGLVLVATFLFAHPARAAEEMAFQPLPERLQPGLDHLLALVGENASEGFDARAADGILHFVATADPRADAAYTAGARKGAELAVHLFDIGVDLQTILRYAYNPQVPAHFTMPRSARLTRWQETYGGEGVPIFWQRMNAKDTLLVRGLEHEETTPDLSSGAYYAYDLDRTLILTRHEGRRVFLSLSRQRGRSEVGRKGISLGPDRNWEYFYSGEEGLTRRGIGWADTYMYRAVSVTVFYEVDHRRPLVRVGSFKWLDAGWLGMNMVKKKHIHQGLRRYAKGMREVLESPQLPSPAELAENRKEIAGLPMAELRSRYDGYIDSLAESYAEQLADRGFLELARAEDYVERMSRAQMEADLLLERFEDQLGRECQVTKFSPCSAVLKNFRQKSIAAKTAQEIHAR